MDAEERSYYNAFNQLPQIGPNRFRRLRGYFPSLQLAWQAPAREFLAAGLEESVVEAIIRLRAGISPEQEMERLLTADVTVITPDDPEYPQLLLEVHNHPALLYVRGTVKALLHPHLVAIVGTRKISSYGKQATPWLVQELVASGVGIVSGLAVGVDAAAHTSSVEAGGVTIAVLGSGVDEISVYPSEHRNLARRIIESGGAVASELPLGSPPLKSHFPYRNRIIAGMSQATIVVEADERSGALITAQAALEYNRDVYAVPGSIFNPVSRGANNLIKQGARVITTPGDLLAELNLTHALEEAQIREIIPQTPLETQLFALLSDDPLHINLLIVHSGLATREVSATLTIMELKGMVKNVGGMQYVKAR